MIIEALKQIKPCENCNEIYHKEKFIDKKYHFMEGYLLEIIDKQASIKGCTECLNSFLGKNHKYVLEHSVTAEEHEITFKPEILNIKKNLITKISDGLKTVISKKITPIKKKGKKHGSNNHQGQARE